MPAEGRVVAVDWSGRAGADQAEHIWVACVEDGRLVALRNGLQREEVIAWLCSLEGPVTVGLDFAFSLPAWWLAERGFTDVRALWQWLRDGGERLIAAKAAPFWGAAGSSALPAEQRFRRTERELRVAKSVFQLAGPGAVGVGSLRGMPLLLRLSGFSIWPFDPPSARQVVEIYPRALTRRPVNKSRWTERRDYLEQLEGLDPAMRERAAGSEDAFDAAVSALAMAAAAIPPLPRATDPVELLEGRVWLPR
jgi:predicted nuclease with RNAse H fold